MELFFLMLKAFLRTVVLFFAVICELVALYVATDLLLTGDHINGAIVTASVALMHTVAYMCMARGVILLKELDEHKAKLELLKDE
jgi:uncharacterized membrane protein